MSWLIYLDLQWELVLFLFDTVSVAVEYMVEWNMETELLNFDLYQFQK